MYFYFCMNKFKYCLVKPVFCANHMIWKFYDQIVLQIEYHLHMIGGPNVQYIVCAEMSCSIETEP